VDDALRAIAGLQRGRQIELDTDLALTAAELALEHRLPMTDSMIYATAQVHGATLWTRDADLKGLDGVRFQARQEPDLAPCLASAHRYGVDFNLEVNATPASTTQT